MSKIEEVARAITSELQAVSYDDLPESASYMERKTHVDRPILDRQEARELALAAVRAIREPSPEMLARALPVTPISVTAETVRLSERALCLLEGPDFPAKSHQDGLDSAKQLIADWTAMIDHILEEGGKT